jgi:hypothetical protein
MNTKLFFLCGLLLWSSIALGQDKSRQVIGKWRVTKLEIPSYEQQIQQATPEQKEQFKKELELMMRYSSFEFKQDGSYQIVFAGQEEKGKWKLNPYGSKLIVEKQNTDGTWDKPSEIAIEALARNNMILLNDYDSGEVVRISLSK